MIFPRLQADTCNWKEKRTTQPIYFTVFHNFHICFKEVFLAYHLAEILIGTISKYTLVISFKPRNKIYKSNHKPPKLSFSVLQLSDLSLKE